MMKRNIKTTLLVVVAVVLGAGQLPAQMRTAYFMGNTTQRLDMNPALAPRRGYFNIPAFGAIGVGVNSNYLTIDNFLYPNPAGNGLVTFMHESVNTDKFLRKLSNNNFLRADVSENILGFGGHAKRYFWSVGLNLRAMVDLNLPKDMFRFLKSMNQGTYDFSNLSAGVDSYLELSLGAAFPIMKNLTVGFRVKALGGLAQASLNVDDMTLSLNDEVWRADMRGQFRCNVAGISFANFGGQVDMNDILDYATDFNNFNVNNVNNWGGAIDLGAEMKLLDGHLRVSAAVNDLGFIKWSQNSSLSGTTNDIFFEYSGVDLESGDVNVSNTEDIVISTEAPQSYTKRLNTTINLGAEYNILHDKIGFGLLSQTRVFSTYTSSELTVSVNFRPISWFGASVSHSLVESKLGVMGLALSVNPCWINLFLGADYLAFRYAKVNVAGQNSATENNILLPLNQSSINFYFGLAVPLAKKKFDR